MAGVAALQAICQRQRVCGASLLSEWCGKEVAAPTQSLLSKHAWVEASVFTSASWQWQPRNNRPKAVRAPPSS